MNNPFLQTPDQPPTARSRSVIPPEDPVTKAAREYNWPFALAKASFDHFEYAAFVVNLGVVLFTDVEYVSPEWVMLKLIDPDDYPAHYEKIGKPLCQFPRGIEVRLSDIRWVADAPFGS